MKKILVALTLSLAFVACNNDSSDPNRDQNDSINANSNNPNEDVQGDRAPVNNSTSNDTNSYERMSGQTARDSAH